MTYVSSEEMKEKGIAYDAIDKHVKNRVTWAVGTGVLGDAIRKYVRRPADSDRHAVLDIGCSGGTTLKFLKPHFRELYGVDIVDGLSDEMRPEVKFSPADLNFDKLLFPDGSFDLVTCFQVIEHLENPFLVVREAYRVLKPGGIFMFSIPNPMQITFRLKFLFTGNMPPWTEINHHLLFLTDAVFKKTYLSRFKLLEAVYQRGAVPLWGRLRTIFGKRLIKKHAMVLPRSKLFGRCVCYIAEIAQQHGRVFENHRRGNSLRRKVYFGTRDSF